MKNYEKIDFNDFRPLLDKIRYITMQYKNGDKLKE